MAAPPLIGLAHGSRDPRAAEAIAELMQAVADLRPGLRTSSAFLDLSHPDLPEAVRALTTPSAVVVPLLFAQAFHARVDVPEAVAAAAASTGVQLRTAEILGLGPAIRAAVESDGFWLHQSAYADDPYPITRALIEDGRRHLLLDGVQMGRGVGNAGK